MNYFDRDSTRLRLLSLNLWNTNNPLQERMAELGSFVSVHKPDVIVLQEVSPVSVSGFELQVDSVPDLVDFRSVYVQTGEWLGRAEGLAILSRRDFRVVKSYRLPGSDSDMDRCALLVSERPGLHILNTHWAFKASDEELRIQHALRTRALLDELLTANPAGAVVVCGDLNDIPGSKPVDTLLDGLDLRNGTNGPDATQVTFASTNRFADPRLVVDRRIDHLYVSGVASATGRVVEVGSEIPASDHYGLLVDLDLGSK